MMCLGWNTKPCTRRDEIKIPSPVGAGSAVDVVGANATLTLCPDITWFWVTGAALLAGALFKGK